MCHKALLEAPSDAWPPVSDFGWDMHHPWSQNILCANFETRTMKTLHEIIFRIRKKSAFQIGSIEMYFELRVCSHNLPDSMFYYY